MVFESARHRHFCYYQSCSSADYAIWASGIPIRKVSAVVGERRRPPMDVWARSAGGCLCPLCSNGVSQWDPLREGRVTPFPKAHSMILSYLVWGAGSAHNFPIKIMRKRAFLGLPEQQRRFKSSHPLRGRPSGTFTTELKATTKLLSFGSNRENIKAFFLLLLI